MKKLVTTLLVASALVWIQPVLARGNEGSGAEIPSDSSAVPPLGESWDVGPYSDAGPALAPLPDGPMYPESAPMMSGESAPMPYTPVNPQGLWILPPESPFAQPFVNSTIPATGMPELQGAPRAPMMFGESAPMPYTPLNPQGPWMLPPESPFAQPFVNSTIPATGMPELPGAPQGAFARSIR